MDAGASQLDDLVAEGFEGGEVEFLGTVVVEIVGCDGAGLEAVGADDLPGGVVADDEVVADFVEGVLVEFCAIGIGEAFMELKIEDLEAEFLGGLNICCGPCEADVVSRGDSARLLELCRGVSGFVHVGETVGGVRYEIANAGLRTREAGAVGSDG